MMRPFGYIQFIHALLLASAPTHVFTAHVRLPSYPLAVKSPYLSTWLPGDQVVDIAAGQPQFWAGQDLMWSVLARVDNQTYALLNAPEGTHGISKAKTDGVSFTSTHTIFSLSAAGVRFTLDFFSPVYPAAEDYAKHSLPYSYLTVNASAVDSHHVQILTTIDKSWTGQNGAAQVNYTKTDDSGFFWFYNPDQTYYTEFNEQATYGSVLFGTQCHGSCPDVSSKCASSKSLFSEFVAWGSFQGDISSCSGSHVVGLAKTMDMVDYSHIGVTFAVGFQRDLAVQYLGEAQTGFHRTKWPTIPEAIDYFLGHYAEANSYSRYLDALVRSKAEAVSTDYGSHYADILEASVRQSFGSLELTVPENNMSAEPSAFLKEISSDGNVNTIDLIFQSWPIFISLNPEWIKLQLKPIMNYLASGRWPKKYVIHDIGTHYPNATGHDDGNEEHMPLFETSSLFILLFAYQKFANDTTFAAQYSSLFPGWAEYLIKNGLYPPSQLISVDAIPASANQTGLAIQSAIGLKAAAALSHNASYAATAESFAHTIYDDALGLNSHTRNSSTHFTYNYGDTDTWNVLFPAYPDVVLDLATFPQTAWDLQSAWYLSQFQPYGLAFAGPESNRDVDWALTDWNVMWASVAPAELRREIVETTWRFMTNGLNTIPFGTKYHVSGDQAGVWIANKARGTVGAHFALTVSLQGRWDLSSSRHVSA
jgi:hypothetical protein